MKKIFVLIMLSVLISCNNQNEKIRKNKYSFVNRYNEKPYRLRTTWDSSVLILDKYAITPNGIIKCVFENDSFLLPLSLYDPLTKTNFRDENKEKLKMISGKGDFYETIKIDSIEIHSFSTNERDEFYYLIKTITPNLLKFFIAKPNNSKSVSLFLKDFYSDTLISLDRHIVFEKEMNGENKIIQQELLSILCQDSFVFVETKSQHFTDIEPIRIVIFTSGITKKYIFYNGFIHLDFIAMMHWTYIFEKDESFRINFEKERDKFNLAMP